MPITNIPPSSSLTPHSPSVDDFRQGAAQNEELQVQLDGHSFKVISVGQTPSARSVAWVSGDQDTTGMFIAALESAVGSALSQVIASELDLRPNPGKPLASRTVEQALVMADTATTALEGVDFASSLFAKGGY